MHGGGGVMDPRVYAWGGGYDLRSRSGAFFFFFLRMTLYFHFQSLSEDLTHNVRGLCPRLSIHVSSVYCSKIDLSF